MLSAMAGLVATVEASARLPVAAAAASRRIVRTDMSLLGWSRSCEQRHFDCQRQSLPTRASPPEGAR